MNRISGGQVARAMPPAICVPSQGAAYVLAVSYTSGTTSRSRLTIAHIRRYARLLISYYGILSFHDQRKSVSHV